MATCSFLKFLRQHDEVLLRRLSFEGDSVATTLRGYLDKGCELQQSKR